MITAAVVLSFLAVGFLIFSDQKPFWIFAVSLLFLAASFLSLSFSNLEWADGFAQIFYVDILLGLFYSLLRDKLRSLIDHFIL